MIAFLTSSPCVYGAPRAILNPENGFVENLQRVLPEPIRCLYICSDPDDWGANDRLGGEMAVAFEEAGFRFRSFEVLDRRMQAYARELVWRSDLIILAGGHVPTQNRFFHEIGLKQLLQNWPGVLMGISAGSMNAAHEVYSMPEMPGESRPEFQRFLPGLGLTTINVLPHYQWVKDYIIDGKRLYDEVVFPDSMGKRFHAFPDGTYIHIENGVELIRGEAWGVQDGIMEKVSEPGDVIAVQ